MKKEVIKEFVHRQCLSFIQDKLDFIAKKHKNIILFGAGHHAEYLMENFDFSAFDIKAVVDSDPNRHTKSFFNHPILPPEGINDMDTDDTGVIIMAYESQRGMIEQIEETINKKIDVFTLYDKDKGESMDCSLYFYKLGRNSGEDRKNLEKLSADYYTMCDYYNAKNYLRKSGSQNNILKCIKNKEESLKQRLQNKHLNICLVILDCVRAKNLSCYGYRRKTSPFIDSLKSESLFFENAFSNSNWTLPGHSTILTGKIPSDHRAWGGIKSYLPDEEHRFPEFLQARGYYTAGCFSITFMNQAFGTSKGFDFYEQGPIEDIIINPASIIMHRALEKVPSDKPFFMMLNFADAHSPFKSMVHRWGSPLADLEKPLNRNLFLKDYDQGELANTVACYDDAIFYMDSQISYLKSLLPQNTLLIITSDHGEAFNEHKGFAFHNDRANLYDEVLHVPLIINHPELAPRAIQGLYPLKNLSGFIADSLEGAQNVKTEDYIIAESDAFIGSAKVFKREIFRYNKACIRTESHKLICSEDGSNSFFELPDEHTNLYEDSKYTKIRKDLKKLLDRESKLLA